jgi:hypothetical protein
MREALFVNRSDSLSRYWPADCLAEPGLGEPRQRYASQFAAKEQERHRVTKDRINDPAIKFQQIHNDVQV